MKKILYLTIFFIKENLKTKIYLVLSIFTLILIFLSFLLTGLSGFEEPQRILIDSAIALIELFSLLVIIFNSQSLLLQDIETKSVYLILSKPVSRKTYLIGRFFGLLGVTMVNIIFMSIVLYAVLFIGKWSLKFNAYVLAIYGTFLKICIISSISLFLIIVMTSQTAGMITSVLVWIAGHFLEELHFIITKTNVLWAQILFKIIYQIVPNFSILNIKDNIGNTYLLKNYSIITLTIYAFIYTSITLFITNYFFNKKNL